MAWLQWWRRLDLAEALEGSSARVEGGKKRLGLLDLPPNLL
jgi:hypothetical protein